MTGAASTATGRRERALRQRAARAGRSGLRVLPFVAAAALFAHFAHYGLRPALEERVRLDHDEREVYTRYAELMATEEELSEVEAALEDEMYRERLRRLFAREHVNEQQQHLEGPASPESFDPTWFGSPGETERLTRQASSSQPSIRASAWGSGSGSSGSLVR
ncbi:MAG: hypothetical protein AAFZ65_11310 [Planctomycetota bacterium]